VDLLDRGQSQNEFISVSEVDRTTFSRHPWSIGGGGAAELQALIESQTSVRLGELTVAIGRVAHTGNDEAYVADARSLRRRGIDPANIATFVEGDRLRDYVLNEPTSVLFPYGADLKPIAEHPDHPVIRWLIEFRDQLWERREPNGTHREIGKTWYEFSRFHPERYAGPGIAFAFVATHNHFVLDRGGKVFKQSAPIIKLTADATEDDHLALLGLLNSSTACFWMKQVFYNKGAGGVNEGFKQEDWEQFREFTGTGLGSFPLPETHHKALFLARELDRCARDRLRTSPVEMVKQHVPSSYRLEANRLETERLQALMVGLQEELDWFSYRLYGLLEDNDPAVCSPDVWVKVPGLDLGQRAFEIVLARNVAAGVDETAWFERHRSTPITAIPSDWPEWYRSVVARRIELIDSNPNIALIERPEYKRRWLREPWDDQVQWALRGWLLDRLETERYWSKDASPELTTCAQLAERAAHDVDFLQVAALYRGRPDFDVPRLVEELVVAEAVPFLPVLRYKPTGLTKRQVWERTWDLQRREDAGEAMGPIPVPPRYTSADFLTSDIWRLRGKLDVPKERFVSYPHCSRDGDTSLVVGWAGWDHLRQATALAAYYERMKTREGWTPGRIAPLLAGLDQLVPWLIQWHNDVHPEYDVRMGDYYRDFVRDEAHALGLTLEAVRAWQPPAKAKGGKGKKKAP
jgi:hypothetical protein